MSQGRLFIPSISRAWTDNMESTSTLALSNGGTGGIIIIFLINWFGLSFVVFSLAEMSSMAPAAGGQYHWASEFAPPSLQKSVSYFSGTATLMFHKGPLRKNMADDSICRMVLVYRVASRNSGWNVSGRNNNARLDCGHTARLRPAAISGILVRGHDRHLRSGRQHSPRTPFAAT